MPDFSLKRLDLDQPPQPKTFWSRLKKNVDEDSKSLSGVPYGPDHGMLLRLIVIMYAGLDSTFKSQPSERPLKLWDQL
jgi:hypothetical protein